MKKYKSKVVIKEAIQWFKNGDHPKDDVFRLFEDTGKTPVRPREGKVVRYFRHPDIPGILPCISSIPCGKVMHYHGWIDTPEGGHNVCPGDWIITGIEGEYYPCKPVIFEKTYEPCD
jgi:hypothetical protein